VDDDRERFHNDRSEAATAPQRDENPDTEQPPGGALRLRN
jgi:hypothetical protein